jgi:predicted DNA-binding protein
MPRQLQYPEQRGQVQFRLPADLIQRLEAEAKRRGVSKTLLAERIMSDGLPRMEKQKV